MGISRPFSGGVHPSRIQEGHGALPPFSRCIAASFHATHGAESVCWPVVQRPYRLQRTGLTPPTEPRDVRFTARQAVRRRVKSVWTANPVQTTAFFGVKRGGRGGLETRWGSSPPCGLETKRSWHPIKDARIFLPGCEPGTRDGHLQVSLPQHRHTEEA